MATKSTWSSQPPSREGCFLSPGAGFYDSIRNVNVSSVTIDIAIFKISRQAPLRKSKKLQDVPPHFEACQITARNWLQSVRGEMMAVNRTSVAFSIDFLAICDDLVAQLQDDACNIGYVIKGLKRIKAKLDAQHKVVKRAGKVLEGFYGEFSKHGGILETELSKVIDSFDGNMKEVELLRNEISKTQSEVHDLVSELSMAKVDERNSQIVLRMSNSPDFIPILGWLATCILASVSASKSCKTAEIVAKLASKQSDQNQLEAKLDELNHEVAIVDMIKRGVGAIISSLKEGMAAVDELDEHWTGLGIKYDNLVADFEIRNGEVGPYALTILTEDLTVAKMKWNEIGSAARELESAFLQPVKAP